VQELSFRARRILFATVTEYIATGEPVGSRKLVKLAKKEGFSVVCDTLNARELPAWIVSRAKRMRHPLEPGVAEALAELAGPELANVVDALERLSLYVGQGATMRPGTEPRRVLQGRRENETIHDEVGMRHFYAEWGKWMNRLPSDPMRSYANAAE